MKSTLLIKRLLLFVLVLLARESAAQLYFKAKALTTADGLSDKRVTCFYKDRKGFMWIGTRNGLNRYDGHSFRVFRPMTTNSISSEVINDIAEDKNGFIWVATMEGLNYYDPVRETWGVLVPDAEKSISTNPNSSIPNYIVWDIGFDKNDLLWIVSDVFEFSSYDIPKKQFTYYQWPKWARAVLNKTQQGKYNSIHKFVRRDDYHFWLGTTKGLVGLDIRTGEFSFLGSGYYGDVLDLSYDIANKKVFLSTEKGQLFMYDEAQNTYSEIFAQPESYPSVRYKAPEKNELWLASDKGLVKISDDRSIISMATNIPQLSGSLLPGGVRSVFEDNNHIRWVATANGISVYDPSGRSSAFLPLLPVSDKEGVNLIGGVYFDAASNCYFVCSHEPAIVFVINAVTGKIKKVTTDANGNRLPLCNTICTDNDNNLWLLTNEYVYRYERSDESFHLFPMPNKGREVAFADMIQDVNGNYWFSTFYKGIYFYNTKDKKFTDLKDTTTKGFRSVTSMVSDKKNKQVLVGTFGDGTFRYDLENDSLTWYYETGDMRNYALLDLVHDMAIDPGGKTWVATHSGGLFRYDHRLPYDKAFKRFDMRSGLSNNHVISICSDGDATMWLLSGSGISAIDTAGRFLYDIREDKTFSFSSFSSDNILPHDIFFNKDKKELLAGVSGGLLFYYPASSVATNQFPVVLTGVTIGDKTIGGEQQDAGTVHRVPFRSNSLSFSYAGLYYGNAPGITYEYMLEGYDHNWVSGGKSYTAIYQNLPARSYTFHVRAKDSKGVVAGEIKGFSFRIVPPFWQTWWFKGLLILAIGVCIWWFVYSLRQKLKAEKLLNSFATSLYGQNTIDDIFWDTTRNCVQKLGFKDCVIYQKGETNGMLTQRAAFGPKNPHRREILNLIEIQVGKGIVGTVAATGKAEIIANTARDPRYIVDDERRLSEITVPIWVDGKVFAVLDSEHPKRNYYKKHHLRLLKKIAGICSERISKYLTEERLRTKIARDLHDEMGSTLTSINIISKVAMEGGMKDDQVKYYLQKIKDNSGRMMESMSDIVWAINPANDSFEKVILRMKEFAGEILEPARINYYFTEEGSLDKAQLNLEQRKDIYMVFKEAVNNAVKYSQATEVNIVLQKKEDSLRMVIMDNGNGFDTEQISSGNGLKNMQSRAKEMKAVLRVDSIKGTGTTLTLEVAIT